MYIIFDCGQSFFYLYTFQMIVINIVLVNCYSGELNMRMCQGTWGRESWCVSGARISNTIGVVKVWMHKQTCS